MIVTNGGSWHTDHAVAIRSAVFASLSGDDELWAFELALLLRLKLLLVVIYIILRAILTPKATL